MSDHSGTINHDTSEPHAKAVFLSIVATVIFFVGTVVLGVLYYLGTSSAFLNQNEEVGSPAELKELHTYEDTQLELGPVPIKQAMQQIVREYH